MTEADLPPPTGDGLARSMRPPLPLIFSITVTGILANTIVGPAIPDILDAFDQGDSRAGVFVAAGSLPGIAMAPVIGILADRFGRRAVVVPCLVTFGVFGLLSALAPSFEILLLLRLLQGVGGAGLINLAVVIIGDHWRGLDRARLVGQNAAVFTTALVLFPPLGGLLTELGGWRLAFAPYAWALVCAALIWRRLDAARPSDPVTVREQLTGARAAMRGRDVLGATSLSFVLFVLIFGLFLTAMPVHLEREFGLSAGARGLVIATPAITSTVFALRLGWLRERMGVVPLVVGSSLLFAVAFAVIGVAGSLPLLVLGAMIYGAGEGVLIPTVQDLVTGSAPPAQRGAVVAMFVSAARAGQTVGPLAASGVYGAVGTGTTFVIGGVVATGMIATELIGRFGAEHS